jgi:hypothetical protein
MGFCVLLERRGITRKNVLVLALALQGIRKKERKKERVKDGCWCAFKTYPFSCLSSINQIFLGLYSVAKLVPLVFKLYFSCFSSDKKRLYNGQGIMIKELVASFCHSWTASFIYISASYSPECFTA